MAVARMLASVGLLVVACSQAPRAEPSVRPTVDITPSDPASRTARAIAHHIQRTYVLVEVWNVSTIEAETWSPTRCG